MHLLRRRWIAVLSGVLLLTLSVSSAFGAGPTDAADDPRGQTIAAFVHSLIFGTEDPPDEELAEEEEDGDEDEAPDGNLDDDGTTHADRVDGAAHGVCVAEVARDADAVGGPNDNHGGAVSEAARETCWEDPAPDEDSANPEVEEDMPPAEEEPDQHGACVSEVARDKEARGGPNDTHGGAVSEAARETCREATEEEPSGVEADETAEQGVGNGNGNGRGGGNGNGPGHGNGGRP